MNKFLEEKEKLLNSIEENTSEHWKEYYKDVPIECIYDDLVIDINEIKRLQEKLDKINEYIEKELKEIGNHQYAIGTRRLKNIQKIINEEG